MGGATLPFFEVHADTPLAACEGRVEDAVRAVRRTVDARL